MSKILLNKGFFDIKLLTKTCLINRLRLYKTGGKMETKSFTREKPPRIPVAELKKQLLDCLIETKEEYSVSQLSSKFGKDRSLIYQLLNQLEDENLIFSRKSKNNNRKAIERKEKNFTSQKSYLMKRVANFLLIL